MIHKRRGCLGQLINCQLLNEHSATCSCIVGSFLGNYKCLFIFNRKSTFTANHVFTFVSDRKRKTFHLFYKKMLYLHFLLFYEGHIIIYSISYNLLKTHENRPIFILLFNKVYRRIFLASSSSELIINL